MVNLSIFSHKGYIIGFWKRFIDVILLYEYPNKMKQKRVWT